MDIMFLLHCFDSYQLLYIPVPEASSPPLSPKESPSPVLAATPSQPSLGISGISPHENHHSYHQLTAITSVGIGVTVISFLLLLVLVFLIRRKSRELDDSENGFKTYRAPSGRSGRRTQDGMIKSELITTHYHHLYLIMCLLIVHELLTTCI